MRETHSPQAQKIYTLLARHNLALCTAESITAGYLCGAIARVSGISAVLRGGLICYQPQVKTDRLGLPPSVAEERCGVSAEAASLMAQGAACFFNAQCAISATGFAEPWRSYTPEAYVGAFIAGKGASVTHLDLKDTKNREEARRRVVDRALAFLLSRLRDAFPG